MPATCISAIMEKKAVFPGSFDPFTKGHEDIVRRALRLFDKIIIGLGHNASKKPRYFEVESVAQGIRSTFRDEPNVSLEIYNELTAQFSASHGAHFLLRGLRNTTDFEFENSVCTLNKHLNKGLETVFLITSSAYAAINSSLIRETHLYGGDVGFFLPYPIDILSPVEK